MNKNKKTTVSTFIRMPEELHRQLKEISATERISMNALMLQALFAYTKKRKKQEGNT